MKTALMFEAMVLDSIMEHGNMNHLHLKHYLLYISEIAIMINQILSKKKKN